VREREGRGTGDRHVLIVIFFIPNLYDVSLINAKGFARNNDWLRVLIGVCSCPCESCDCAFGANCFHGG
jgi:hypothetical protein